MYRGQVHQDEFVLKILKEKRNGYFIELGSSDPISINNSYLLETAYNWKGIMIDIKDVFLTDYKKHRPNSIHVINDATQIDYKNLLETHNTPFDIDYLQIDLEVDDDSTIKTLEKLDAEIFDNYKFATVTFEHDTYNDYDMDTRIRSRDIFKKRGYVRVFDDVNIDGNPFEDWYVYPDLVDMNYVNKLIENNIKNYVEHPILGKTISHMDINYDT
jgi:hypothetical protein